MASLRINLAIAVAILNSVASGFHYMIGDSIWTIPPSSDFYSSWSSSHSFYIGDSLVFEFGMELFNVVQVMRNDYESCTGDSPLKVFRSSPAVVELTYKGVFYYICNVSNYCDLGQKVSIVVLQRPSSAPISSPPLPFHSPPLLPPPSSSSSTPPLPSGPPSLPPSTPTRPVNDPSPPLPGVENNHSPSPSSYFSSNSVSSRAGIVYFLFVLVMVRIVNSDIV